jgi:hypothetical protein
MKSRIALISIVLLLISAFFVSALTLEEAKAWIVNHPEQAAQDIVDWDTVQQAKPSFVFPDFAAIVMKDRSVDIVPADKLKITIAGSLLAYDVTFPPLHYPELYKCEPGKWAWVQPTFWGFATGATIVTVAWVLITVFAHPMPAIIP